MSQMKVITKGKTSPQGKPRVYFSCHPQDFALYFDAICKDIHKFVDCAIYYFDPAATRDWIVEEELSQMQLFVMPITERLLNQDNNAIRVEFAYAQEHHIPVLPLMQGTGLEEKFNHVCGDLHCLDKKRKTTDGISYEDQLKTFLNSVLIGEKLSAQIRAAFDAYIFLSYRKKDRKYAQELMRLIHKNDFCRDIAIWYDEFLVPGENFNNAIEKALEKSALFALAVTPNLINESNYVMTTEFPKAMENHKTILPVEMVQTDSMELQSKYPGIPSLIDGKNENSLRQMLLSALQTVAMSTRNSTPEHVYLIGMAYLGGIDVEVDRKKALELIQQASAEGLPAATKQLANMYHRGDGVERNSAQELFYRELLLEQTRIIYEASGDGKDGMYYFSAALDLGEAYQNTGKLVKAYEIVEKSTHICEQAMEEITNAITMDAYACAFGRLSRICREMQAYEEAKEYIQFRIEINEVLYRETKEVKYLSKLSDSYSDMASACKALHDESKYHYYLQKSFDLIQEAGEFLKDDASREVIARGYRAKGDEQFANKNFLEANKAYQETIRLYKLLLEQDDSVDNKAGLADGYYCLGRTCEKLNDLEQAKEYYEQFFVLTEQLKDEIDSVQILYYCIIACHSLARIEIKEENHKKALELLLKELPMAEELAKKAQNLSHSKCLINTLFALAEVQDELDKGAEAVHCLEYAKVVAEELYRQTKDQWCQNAADRAKKRLEKIRFIALDPNLPTWDYEYYQKMFERANANDAEALYMLYIYYSEGKVIAKDEEKAQKLLLKAAQLNQSSAQLAMAKRELKNGNTSLAYDWMMQSVKNHDRHAYRSLSRWYRTGKVVKKNIIKAFLWRLRAAVADKLYYSNLFRFKNK